MPQVATRRMTFDQFFRLPEEDLRYELVDGRLDPLMPPDIAHGTSQSRIAYYLYAYLGPDFKGILGTEIDFPTLPFQGRRGDLLFVAPEHVTQADWDRGYPSSPPDLVIEVVSAGQEQRDYGEKLREYAMVGIGNYWIVDPMRRAVQLFVLDGEKYRLDHHFQGDDVLTSPLFPGLQIPLASLFSRP